MSGVNCNSITEKWTDGGFALFLTIDPYLLIHLDVFSAWRELDAETIFEFLGG